MSRVLVTGAAGYVGASLVSALLERGDRVVATDRNPISVADARLEHRIGDLLDERFVATLFDAPYDLVIHAAAAVPLASRSGDDYARINVGSTRLLARASRGSGFFVLIGSSAVWGRPREIVTATTREAPFEAYGRSKLEAERVLADELAGSTTRFAIVRPRTIVGPGRGGLFEVLVRWIRAGLPIPLAAGGRARLGLVGIDDLVGLTLHLGDRRIEGVWPAAAPGVRPLAEEIGSLIATARSESFVFSVPGPLLSIVGRLLFALRLAPFRPWHVGGWSSPQFLVDERWRPEGFAYRKRNGELLAELLAGTTEYDASPHRSRLATPTVDRLLRLLRPLARLVRIR